MIASVFAVILLASFASAASLAISNQNIPTSVAHDAGSFTITFDVTNTGTADTNVSYSASSISSGTATISGTDFSIADGTGSAVTSSQTVTVSFDEHQAGPIAGTIVVDDSGTGAAQSLAFSVPITAKNEISVSDATITDGSNSTTVTVKNEGNTQLTNINLSASGDFSVTFSGTNVNNNKISSLSAGGSQTVTVTGTDSELDDLLTGTVTVTASSDQNVSDTGTVTFQSDFCGDTTNPGDLKINIEDIKVKSGFGDDDNFWYPFDEVEVELTIEPGKYDIDKVEVEWELYTESGDKIDDDKESKFNLDEDDDDKEITVSFTLDRKLNKLENEDSMTFFVRAEGEIDDNNAGSDDNKKSCVSTSQDVDLTTDDEFVIIDDLKILPEVVSCGGTIQVSGDVWNVGDNEQEDVIVRIFNEDLGINQKIEYKDIKEFSDEKLDASFNIPETAVEKMHVITIEVFNEDGDLFETDEDEDKARFTEIVQVQGSCSVPSKATISATVESGGKAGKELVIKSTITNSGSGLATYAISAGNYADWAESVEIDTTAVALEAGASKEVKFTFDVKNDVSGEKTFDIDVLSGNKLVKKQPVSITIDKGGFSLSGITGNVLGGDGESKWHLWVIGALNVLLVIIIIAVALRIAKS